MRDFPIAEEVGDAAISLTFFSRMSLEDVDTVVARLHNILDEPAARAGIIPL